MPEVEDVGDVAVLFVAASAHLEELQAVLRSLLPTEAGLAVAGFALVCTAQKIFKGNLFVIRSPSMRKDSIVRNVLANKFD